MKKEEVLRVTARQLVLDGKVAEVAPVTNAARREHPARVAAAEQLPEKIVVRRLARARGEEQDGVPGLDRIERAGVTFPAPCVAGSARR